MAIDREFLISATSGLFAVVLTLVVTLVGVPLWPKSWGGDDQAVVSVVDEERLPVVRISAVNWTHPELDGQYEIIGEVDDMGPGQLLWFFNQPKAAGSKVYIEAGPCPVDGGGRFTCRYGYAGESADQGKEFAMFVAVMTPRQAAAMTQQRTIGDAVFNTSASIPRIEDNAQGGGEAVAEFRTVRPIR